MDAEMDRRRRAVLPPFDGLTVYSHCLPVVPLREALASIVDDLHARSASSRLIECHDWHEHDGAVTPSWSSSWADLRSWVRSDEGLGKRAASDDYVRTGFAPEERDWYLRIYVLSDCDFLWNLWDTELAATSVPLGMFDVTCEPRLSAHLLGLAHGAGAEDVSAVPAASFFDSRYDHPSAFLLP